MKVLIWVGTGFIITLLNSMLWKPLGFKLGWLLLYIVWFIVARILCNKLDAYRISKISAKAASEGTTTREYIYKDISQDCIEMCEFYRGQPTLLETYLSGCLKNGAISNDAYIYLFEEYRK